MSSTGRTRVVMATVASAAVVVIIVVVLLLGRGSSTGPVAAAAYPRAYVVVYRVIQNGTQHWQVLSVQRPFAASDLTYTTTAAPRNGDQPGAGDISTVDGLYAVGAGTVRLVSGRQPGVPAGDQYLGAALTELTRRGLARDLGRTATVAGRTCRIYRFAAPPSGPVAPLDTGSDHDDLCFDAEGLELSEAWTYRGAVVLQRTAVDVRTSSSASAVRSSAPPAPPTAGAAAAGPNAATVTPDVHPSTFIADPPPPQGFVAAGPAVDFRFPNPQNTSQAAATSVVWAFTDGARVITVEAGSESGGGLPWSDQDTVTEPIDLSGLGPAATAIRSDGFELRIDLGQGAWVRVRGTVPLDELIAYGHRLTRASAAPTAG